MIDPEVAGSVPVERSHLVLQHILIHAALQGGATAAVHQAGKVRVAYITIVASTSNSNIKLNVKITYEDAIMDRIN